MNYSFWQKVAQNPWWIYPLIAYFIYIGIKARQPRLVSLQQFHLFFSIYILCSIGLFFSMNTSFLMNVLYWCSGFSLGVMASSWQRSPNIKAVRHAKSFYVPGSWNVLLLFVFIFLCHYYFVFTSLSLAQLHKLISSQMFLFFYALAVGLALGRLRKLHKILRDGPFVEPTNL